MVKTQTLEPFKIAYIRLTGPYGEGIPEAMEKIGEWAKSHDIPDANRIHIFHDDPDVTPAEECRADIGMMVPEDVETPHDIALQEIPAGEYATLRKIVTEFSQYGEMWESLMEQIEASDSHMGDGPCFELYHTCDEQATDVSVYISLA